MNKRSARTVINGVQLYWELTGEGKDTLVLVHGSWVDHHAWDAVVPALAQQFRVLTYDRRGHSQSERLQTQGSVDEDVFDLAGLIDDLCLKPAYLAGSSFGASILLRLAGRRPDLFAGLIAHEPPLFGLIPNEARYQEALRSAQHRIDHVVQLLQQGDIQAGARVFVETIAFGPGAWEQLPIQMQQTFVFNAPTWLDEMRDSAALNLDLSSLRSFAPGALVTGGGQSAPFFRPVLEQIAQTLPHVTRYTFEQAGHVPHITHSDEYVQTIARFGNTSTVQPPFARPS